MLLFKYAFRVFANALFSVFPKFPQMLFNPVSSVSVAFVSSSLNTY